MTAFDADYGPPTSHPNDPRNDDNVDAITWLVQKYFNKNSEFCMDECPRYRVLSESCECLDEGMAVDCPELSRLEEEAVRDAMEQYP